VRFCGNNTGNEDADRNWGEAICFTDGTLTEATANTAVPEAQHLVIGTPQLAMMDNMALQPGRGNWILHEDGAGPEVGRNNDLWSCLEDGEDDDFLSDGCVRVAAQRPERRVDGRHLRRLRARLLREPAAQRHRPRRDPPDHRLGVISSTLTGARGAA
jgi:hypothetical protein